MLYILSFLWLLETTKLILFYIYLWQLKEYQVKRFLDHFRTTKGISLFFNNIYILKIIISPIFIFVLLSRRYDEKGFFPLFLLGIVFAFYAIDLFKIIKGVVKKSLLLPVFTKKTILFTVLGIIMEFIFLTIIIYTFKDIYFTGFWFLVSDIFLIFVISFLILFFQPFSVFYRNFFIINKAKKKKLKFKKLITIGITGSYGKTSTKEILNVILSEKFNVLKTEKHQNSEVGISKTIIDKLNQEHEIFIVEMGAYGKGGIKLLCDIAKPNIGILTGINQQHISLFGSQSKIIKTKYELIENLTHDGLGVFNGDNKYCRQLYEITAHNKRIYQTRRPGVEEEIKPDIWAEDIKMELDNVTFKVCTPNESRVFKVAVIGAQNVPNILACIIIAKELGVKIEEISQALSKIKLEDGSITFLSKGNDPYILNSSYSSNPNGIMADLDYLTVWPNKKAIIMPCLIELGEHSKKIHKEIGKKIGKVCDLAIITTKERFEDIKEGAVEAGMKRHNILFVSDPEDIVNQINIFSDPGDVVMLEGRVSKRVISLLK